MTTVKETKNLGNSGQQKVTITEFLEQSNYAYPWKITSTFTGKNSAGQPITQTIQNTMTYNLGTGQLLTEGDGDGNLITYNYDNIGRLTNVTYPSFSNQNGVTYDVNDEYTYTYSNTPADIDPQNAGILNLAVSTHRKYVQRSNGQVTILSNEVGYYDGLGFLMYDQLSGSNGQNQITQNRKDDLGRIVYSLDPSGSTVSLSYDTWGDQNEVTDAFGNLYVTENKLKDHQIIHYFVAAGDVSNYRNNPSQTMIKSNYVEQDYDQWGQLLTNRVFKDWPARNSPSTENYTYDIIGNMLTYTDPKKNLNDSSVTTKLSYDKLNRLIEVKDALNQIAKYQYNANGKIIGATIQKSTTDTPLTLYTKTYNEIGSISSNTDSAGNQVLYGYNNLGLLNQINDRNGSSFAFHYDQQNRLTDQSISGSNGTNQQVKLILGSNGILFDTNLAFKDGTQMSSVTTQMDNLKRLVSIQVTGNNQFVSNLGLKYDASNRITSLTSSNGLNESFNTNYRYIKSRLDKIQIDGQNVINDADSVNVKYAYYPDGKVKSITYPPLTNGSILKTEYTYDNLSRISRVSNTKGSSLLSSTDYLYDENGNVTKSLQTMVNQPTYTNTYTYDKLNRLESVTRSDGTSINYSYDLRGNRFTMSRNLPNSFEDRSYKYDLNNSLVQVTQGTSTTAFDYDAMGTRYKKTTASKVTQYRYNSDQEVIAEADSSNHTIANYVRGDRLLVKKDASTNNNYYFLYNGHGDVIQIVDTSGNVVNYYTYDEWGQVVRQTEGISNMFKYAGEVYDDETGLYYLRARYYDPSDGRFINEDTYEGQIDNPLSLNLYTYVENNPLIFADPSGFNPVGPGNGNVFDSNQWAYLSNLATGTNAGAAAWANEQIKKQLYYKSAETSTSNSSGTIALPAPGSGAGSAAGTGFGAAVVNAIGKVAGAIGMILTLSGDEADFEKERRNTVYRALTAADVTSLASGKGLVAKNVSGDWSALDHILKGSQAQALIDDPWISTTKSLSVAQGYDSGYGIVAIDLRKVTSPYVYQALQYNSKSKIANERIAYQRAVWSQEISVYQYIPQGAIIGYV